MSLQPRLDFVTCVSPLGFHRMAYWEWGDPDNREVLLCVHGLTRNGRDFDRLARELAPRYRVVCPDVAGRGQSDWLANPALYNVPQYVSDMMTLIARLHPARLAWVGTSMGGLIGLGLSGALAYARAAHRAHPHAGALPPDRDLRIDRMVLNDVGPHLAIPALDRIIAGVGTSGAYATFDEAIAATRISCANYGPHSDEHWRELAEHGYVRNAEGRWVKNYDLNIGVTLGVQASTPQVYEEGERMLWHAYDTLDCPILILRGEHSDLLLPATVADMLARNPRASVHEIAEAGHAPTLMTPEQIAPVAQFLLA